MSRNYLASHDYGQGAISWFVFANSADEILRRVPQVDLQVLRREDLHESIRDVIPQTDLNEPDDGQFHESFVDVFENEDGTQCESSVIPLYAGLNGYLVELYVEGCKIYRYLAAGSGDEVLETFPELTLIGHKLLLPFEQIVNLERGVVSVSDYGSPEAFMADFSDLDGHDNRDDVHVYCRHGRLSE